MHRDIKPENIGFREKDNLESLALIDFGFAQIEGQNSMNLKTCGSPGYVAPEIINNQKKYDCKCDVFSAGVILF